MRTEEEIVSRIIETSRKIGKVENKKYELQNMPIDDKEDSKKDKEEALLSLDFEINSLGSELNALKWVFSKETEV